VLFLAFALSVLSLSAVAQTTAGRILGSVTDQSGASVPGASVVVTDVQRGTSRTLTTDDAGSYAATNLQPGTYQIRVEAKGFKTTERPNLQVEVASDVRADFTLQTGQVSETVTISDEVPLLNTTSATLGGTLSNKEINDLPLSGRNYENLLQLRPGVMRYPGGGFSTTSSNGLRAEDNAYFLEGLFNSEPYSGQAIVNGAGIAGDSAMEAGIGRECGVEGRDQQRARNGLWLWARRGHGRTELLQPGTQSETDPDTGAIRWKYRGADHQG
jgi:hypothetical protein